MKNKTLRLAIWCAVSKPDKTKPSDPDVKDKYSLKDQELLGIAFAKEHDYEVVKVFRWPGYSRDESDVIQALEDFAKAGRLEYHELREMWRNNAFDVLWCHNHSRLGRSFTLQAWVIENVIRSGARVYRHVGGWIDQADYGGQIALGGFANAQERERRLVQNDAGLTARAQKGLNLTRIPFPHRLIRDPVDGKALRMEIDPANRLFLDHLYDLLMEGVPMKTLGRELFLRYGHSNPQTGRAWHSRMVYEMLHRPSFWGHTARKFSKHHRSMFEDCWGFDENAPLPEGVIMFRNTHEPAYEGDRAQDVQSAIRFLKRLKGVNSQYRVHPLSGLVFCPECYHQMHYNKSRARHRELYYLYCPTHYDYACHNSVNDCANTRHIREPEIWAFIDKVLDRFEAGEDLTTIFAENQEVHQNSRVDALSREVERQRALIDRLIMQSAEVSETLTEHYRRLLQEADHRLQTLESDLRLSTERESAQAREKQFREQALSNLGEIPRQELWSKDAPTVNRLLKDVFGRYAIFVLDGQIIGINLKPVRGNSRGMPYVRP